LADLQNIFSALVPENIRNLPLIKDAMGIFLSTLEENAAVAWDISNVYSSTIKPTDSNILKLSKDNLRKGLLNVYLESLYSTIIEAQQDKNLNAKLNSLNLNSVELNKPAHQILGDEYFLTNKHIKETVGTISSLKYAHEFAAKLESNTSATPLKINPIKPFHFLVESNITSEMYANIVEPLSHPVGFTYAYTQIVEQALQDYFGFHKTYNVNAIEIRGSSGTFDVFSPLGPQAATAIIWADFQTRTNINTGSPFTLTEFNALVTVHSFKIVQDITEVITHNTRQVSIMFTDGTTIVQSPGIYAGLDLYYVQFDIWHSNASAGILKDFTPSTANGHYSLFLDYTFNKVYNYTDNLSTVLNFNISAVNDLTGNAGGITYTAPDGTIIPQSTSDYIAVTDPNVISETFSSSTFSSSGTGKYFGMSTSYLVSTDVGGGFYLTAVI